MFCSVQNFYTLNGMFNLSWTRDKHIENLGNFFVLQMFNEYFCFCFRLLETDAKLISALSTSTKLSFGNKFYWRRAASKCTKCFFFFKAALTLKYILFFSYGAEMSLFLTLTPRWCHSSSEVGNGLKLVALAIRDL